MKGADTTHNGSRRLYKPGQTTPFRLSRNKIELFIRCPRCFYMDRRFGIGRPPGFPYLINSAIDTLFKREFDHYRVHAKPHPIMTANNIDAIPFQHLKIDIWRANFTGITHTDPRTGFTVFGAMDDIWMRPNGELIVADYKATSKEGGINLISKQRDEYKRQLSVYQWLLRKNGFDVSHTSYLVYANGKTDRHSFDGKMEFDVELFSYHCPDAWIEPTLIAIKDCLDSPTPPTAAEDCEHCAYHAKLAATEQAPAEVPAKEHQAGLFEQL